MNGRKTLSAILMPAALVVSGGCSVYQVRVPGYAIKAPQTQEPAGFLAGTAKVDITPPPGFPIAGHSISAGVARGYWSKLYARAFYFRDAGGRPLVLVSCDLFAVPAGLRSEVLRRVNEGEKDQPKVYLPPESFILSATHTHHGPGGYMTSAVYNGLGAALPGFDLTLFNTYAERLTSAVRQAAHDARPATIEVRQGSAPYLQRNRAIDPFFQNSKTDRDALNRLARDGGVRCEDCLRLSAVDPTLTTLQFSKDGQPFGLLVFYAIHPTAMSHENPLYSADLTGRAMSILEKEPGMVAGFFNGAEGDISPDWDRQNRDDVLRLGERLAAAVKKLQESPRLPSVSAPTLLTAMEKYPNNWHYQQPNGQPKLAFEPLAGAAQIGGAEDGRTAFFYLAGWRAGIVSDTPTGRNGDQGNKEPGLRGPTKKLLQDLDAGWLASLPIHFNLTRAITNHGFPAKLPILVAQIGDLVTIASIPVEMTATMGMRVREGLKGIAPSGRIVLVGLANEYFSYTTTPEEYVKQQYEGASTLAGPQEGPAILEMLKDVAKEIHEHTPQDENVHPEKYAAGAKRVSEFSPRIVGKPRNMIDEDLDPLMPPYLVYHEWRIPRAEWSEPDKTDWGTQDRHIRVRDAGRMEVEADGSPNLLTVLADPGEEPLKTSGTPHPSGVTRRWNALWIPPYDSDRERWFYFEVATPDGRVLCSERFQLGGPPEPHLHALPVDADHCH